MHFASLVPELAGAASEGSSGSALTGCERDCAKLAGRALLLLQQVPILGDLLSPYFVHLHSAMCFKSAIAATIQTHSAWHFSVCCCVLLVPKV